MKKVIILVTIICIAFSANFPLFKQCDSRWGSNQIGTSSETICKVGCLMSSVSMVLNSYGVEIDGQESDPGTLNEWLTNNGGYASGDLFIWASIEKFGFNFETSSLDKSEVIEAFDSGKLVILNVRNGGHFVLMTDYTGNTLYVNDPGFSVSSYDLSNVVRAGIYTRSGKVPKIQKLKMSIFEYFGWGLNQEASPTCGSCENIQAMVSASEGTYECVYTDSLGNPTIGIGFNLNRSGAQAIISGLGLDYSSVVSGSQCLTQAQITQLFQNDLQTAESGAAQCVGSYSSQPECVENVLIDMSFNMGASALCGWPELISQLASFEYSEAASNMQGSTWCGQVGNRCTRDVGIISSCTS